VSLAKKAFAFAPVANSTNCYLIGRRCWPFALAPAKSFSPWKFASEIPFLSPHCRKSIASLKGAWPGLSSDWQI